MIEMRIGFDFDNTIVNYDSVFFKVALEQALIPQELPRSKLAVRDYLRRTNREAAWIELQGYVYGMRMNEADAYSGVIPFMELARRRGSDLTIVSHKTRKPFSGAEYDLHAAASEWVERYLVEGDGPLVEQSQVFFEATKAEKVARIGACGCDYFIDDLPEVLLMSDFPTRTVGILFQPNGDDGDGWGGSTYGSWEQISTFFMEKWNTNS